jgi:hypothetical protein
VRKSQNKKSLAKGLFIIKGGQAVFIKLVFAKNELNGEEYRCPQLILS